jgi:predicted RNA polymerase sigma factor
LDADSEHLLRELAPQVLGVVLRHFRDFAAAEDAVQEALLAATVQWPREGVPDNSRAWLIQVASRRMTDHVRRELARQRRETAAAMLLDQITPAVDMLEGNCLRRSMLSAMILRHRVLCMPQLHQNFTRSIQRQELPL